MIFYFNGTHADYHQATDTPDKIEYDLLLENRTRLVFHTAWEVANRDEAVRVDKASGVTASFTTYKYTKKASLIEKLLLFGWKTGFEPATLGTTNQCSNQLSYNHRLAFK